MESLLWLLGTGILHLLGVLLIAGLLISAFVFRGIPYNDLAVLEFLESQELSLLAGEQFVFVTGVLILAWWRLGGNLGHRLSSRPLPFQHLFLLTCLVIPLSTICTAFHSWGMAAWVSLMDYVPALQQFNTTQAMHVLESMSTETPVWALLLVFAVAPALGEEIVFRGVIGRGLIHRWGMPLGILVTSILFAVAHLHPVHALAVLPMGIVLHYVYVTTRSFWAPLYLHFCNNAYAVLQATDPVAGTQEIHFSAGLTVTLSLVLFLSFLWVTRVRCVRHDGLEWTPPRPSLELPVEVPLTLTFSSLPWRLSLGGLVPLLGFLAARAAQI